MDQKMARYLMEDIATMPSLMKDLDLSDVTSDPACKLTLQERCEVCYNEGTSDACVHPNYKGIEKRRRSLKGRDMTADMSLDLAQAGFFMKDECLTCFHCGQVVLLRKGTDPKNIHADVFRNCKQTCRNLGHTDRRPRSGTEMTSCPSSPLMATRRRHGSI